MSVLDLVRKAADVRDVHVDVPLSNISVAYIQSASEFQAANVFPIVPVDEQSGVYYKFAKETFFRNRAKLWTPGTQVPQGQFDVNKDNSYFAQFRAFEFPLRWDIRANADAVLRYDQAAAEFVTRVLLLSREIEWASTYFKAGVWANEYQGVASAPTGNQFIQWSDYTNSDPIEDIKKARLAIKRTTGFMPNTLLVSEEVFETLADHPAILQRYQNPSVPVLSREQVARALRVDRLLVAGAIQITSPEGAAVESYDWIYGKHALLVYAAPRPSLLAPSGGYIFSWTGMTRGFETAVERITGELANYFKTDFIRGYQCYDMRVVGPDLGAFFLNAIA